MFMSLGAFSVSLTVSDIAVSRAFYEKLGFSVFAGEQAQGWLIMKSGLTAIGLFQGMFERNMLTFNPGWNHDASEAESYTDIRILQKQLQDQGIAIAEPIDETSTGPASFSVTDPDGNPILFDQHR